VAAKLVAVFLVSYILIFSVRFGMIIERVGNTNWLQTVFSIVAIIMICYLAGVASGTFPSISQIMVYIQEAFIQ
jgi:hypothetical protein